MQKVNSLRAECPSTSKLPPACFKVAAVGSLPMPPSFTALRIAIVAVAPMRITPDS